MLPCAVPAPATPTLLVEVTSPKFVVTAGVHCAATKLNKPKVENKKTNTFTKFFFIFSMYKQAKRDCVRDIQSPYKN
ncbi:MAG: hypothetical protein WCJ45_07780, partial [bacterium]